MGKDYLSSEEKSVVLTIGSFIAYMSDKATVWEKLKRSKDQIKYAKMARSFAQKSIDLIMQDVSEEQVTKLVGGNVVVYKRGPYGSVRAIEHVKGEMADMQVVVKYRDEAKREYARIEKLDENVSVAVGDLDQLLYFGMASCSLCDLCGQDVTDCDIRKLFIKYHGQPLNLTPGEGCPFRKDEEV